MLRFAVLFIFLFGTPCWANSYKLVSLFTKEALVTGRFLPFKVYDQSDQALRPREVYVYGPCESMMDRHRPEVFHIYCVEEGSAEIIVRLPDSTHLSSGDLLVKKLSLIEPDIILPGPTKSLGEKLFTDNCVECHRSQAIRKPQTEASLKAALAREPMKGRALDKIFNDDEEKIKALLQYINEEL